MNTHSSLVEALIQKQIDLGLSDVKFAARLGVHRRMWDFVKRGELQPGSRTLKGVRQAFPDLIPELLDFFLPENSSRLTSDASQVTDEVPT